MNSKYYQYILFFLFLLIGNNEKIFSQKRDNAIGSIINVSIDTLPTYEARIGETNILFKVPSRFNRCKQDSIRLSSTTFSYSMNVFNQSPGIIQSKDQQMFVFLYDPFLFENSDRFDWKHKIGYRDNLIYKDFVSKIKTYSSKIAKKLFNADSLFVWERAPRETENVFAVDTVNLGGKFIERLDRNYRIENEVFWQYYPYCKTMLIKKNNVGFIFIYLYFTEEGIKRESKYIHALKKMFWFT